MFIQMPYGSFNLLKQLLMSQQFWLNFFCCQQTLVVYWELLMLNYFETNVDANDLILSFLASRQMDDNRSSSIHRKSIATAIENAKRVQSCHNTQCRTHIHGHRWIRTRLHSWKVEAPLPLLCSNTTLVFLSNVTLLIMNFPVCGVCLSWNV